jgi:hypothetical protein
MASRPRAVSHLFDLTSASIADTLLLLECMSNIHGIFWVEAKNFVNSTVDGVNSSPALEKVCAVVFTFAFTRTNSKLMQADLGIAMNISGSDVLKEASDMILLGASSLKSMVYEMPQTIN